MKKIIQILLSLFIAFLFVKCNDTIDPKSEFNLEYAVNFILRGDTTLQICTLTKSYDVQGFDPSTYKGNPFVTDAEITLIYDGTPYNLINSTKFDNAQLFFNSPYPVYYLNNFKIDKRKHAELMIKLADGTGLHSSTDTPAYQYIIFKDTDASIPPGENKTEFRAAWGGSKYDREFETLIFQPQLRITYAKLSENLKNKYTVTVPSGIEKRGEAIIETFPPVSNRRWAAWNLDMIEYAFQNISGTDTNKSDYVIYDAKVILRIFDKNLGNYLAALQTFLDSYSVQVGAPDLSNIEGGFGVFGSYLEEKTPVEVFNYYIISFGYTPASLLIKK